MSASAALVMALLLTTSCPNYSPFVISDPAAEFSLEVRVDVDELPVALVPAEVIIDLDEGWEATPPFYRLGKICSREPPTRRFETAFGQFFCLPAGEVAVRLAALADLTETECDSLEGNRPQSTEWDGVSPRASQTVFENPPQPGEPVCGDFEISLSLPD